jgi:hypothetical protein
MEVSREFVNIGWNFPGGLPYRSWARTFKTRMAENGKTAPLRCRPAGIVKTINPLFRVPQMPGLLVILNERDTAYRQIFTDGRPLPLTPPYAEWLFCGQVGRRHTGGETNGFPTASGLTAPAVRDRRCEITEQFHRVNYGKMKSRSRLTI